MKSKLISFILALCLLIAIPLSAKYKYNPYTRKLDYYEPAGAATLGDLSDVTLSSLAEGAILYRNAGNTAWVNLAKGTDGQYLSMVSGLPSWATDLILSSVGAHYYGAIDVDSTWKTVRDGTKLSFLRRESGAYVEKGYFDATSFHSANIYVGNVRLEEEGGCLATNEFHAHGVPPVAGYFKFYQGTTPAAHKEAGHSILWVDANDVLYLEKPDGTDVEVGSVLKDIITITGDNATLKLEDDSGNFGIVKAGNSQLTIAADPDNAVASTDIVFDIDGVEVGRFQQGKGFQSKRGFATELWDIVGGHWETATTGVEYYSPNQQGGIYGTIYRQYFLTSLPSDLTSGNNVSALVDYNIQFMSEGVNLRGIAHGSASATETSDKRCSIWLAGSTGSNNLQIDKESTGDDYEPVRGWVDYTK